MSIHILDTKTGKLYHFSKLDINPRIGEEIDLSVTNVPKGTNERAKGQIINIKYTLNMSIYADSPTYGQSISETLLKTIYIK